MPDPAEESPPPPQPPPPPPSGPESPRSTSTGLPSNIAAALACIPLVGGIVFFILEKQDKFVRFYAMQSIVFGAAWLFFWIVYSVAFAILTPIPVIGFIFSLILVVIRVLVGVAFLVLWIVATWKALTGAIWEIPYVGPIARKQLGETSAM